jgi:hypothetical protein
MAAPEAAGIREFWRSRCICAVTYSRAAELIVTGCTAVRNTPNMSSSYSARDPNRQRITHRWKTAARSRRASEEGVFEVWRLQAL